VSNVILWSDTHFHNFPQFGGPKVPEGASFESGVDFPGCNGRAQALLRAAQWAFKYATDNNIKHLVHAGDVFHTKGLISVPVYNAVCRIFREASLVSGLENLMIPGNHDLVGKADRWSSLHTVYALPGVKVSQAPDVRMLDVGPYKLAVAMVPYMSSKKTLLEALQQVATKVADLRSGNYITHAILVMHVSVIGAVTGPHEYVMKEGLNLREIPFEAFDLVTSGHYHKRQVIESKRGDFVYIGALAQHNFGERDYTPGFLQVELQPKGLAWRQIENEISPRFHQVELDCLTELVELAETVKNSPDYVRVAWRGPRLPVGLVLPTNLDLTVGVSPVEVKPRLEVSVEESPQELIKKYVEFKAPGELDEDELVKLGLELMGVS
jgi:DNA repair exonuclease SbcCD nuclease subunit